MALTIEDFNARRAARARGYVSPPPALPQESWRLIDFADVPDVVATGAYLRRTDDGWEAATNVVELNTDGDIVVPGNGDGVICKSPDGSQTLRIGISNAGAVVATAVA